MLTQAQIRKKYGEAKETGTPYLTVINLPYPMKLAWDLKTTVNKIRCHKLIAKQLFDALSEVYKTYGPDQVKKLGLDLYGGCFEYRKMRGGQELSRHSWGIAIDLDPSRNQLAESHKTARFARPEYKKLMEIFYKHGFVNMGIEKDYDYMHFEIKS